MINLICFHNDLAKVPFKGFLVYKWLEVHDTPHSKIRCTLAHLISTVKSIYMFSINGLISQKYYQMVNACNSGSF